MQKREIEQLYQSVCDAFPAGTVRLLRRGGGEVSTCERYAGIPAETGCSMQKEAMALAVGERHFQRISLPLPPESQLFLYLAAEDYPDIFTPVRMVDSLQKLIAAGEDRDAGQSEDTTLANTLIHIDTVESKTYASLLAAEAGKDLSIPRVACLFDIDDGDYRDKGRFLLQEIRRFRGVSQQDILGGVGENNIVLFRTLQDDQATVKHQCGAFLDHLRQALRERYGLTPRIFVGTAARQVEEYNRSFQMAADAQRFSREEQGEIIFASDHILEFTYTHTEPAVLRHFLEGYAIALKGTPELVPVAEALIRNNMSLALTSEQLFLHRNTVSLYTNRLRDLLGINPQHRDSDRFLLMLICAYYRQNY